MAKHSDRVRKLLLQNRCFISRTAICFLAKYYRSKFAATPKSPDFEANWLAYSQELSRYMKVKDVTEILPVLDGMVAEPALFYKNRMIFLATECDELDNGIFVSEEVANKIERILVEARAYFSERVKN